MVVHPYLTIWAVARQSANPERLGIAFGMTFGVIMMAFEAFLWVGSLVMLIINVFTNRHALRSKVGIITVLLDLVVLAYAVLLVSLIARDCFESETELSIAPYHLQPCGCECKRVVNGDVLRKN